MISTSQRRHMNIKKYKDKVLLKIVLLSMCVCAVVGKSISHGLILASRSRPTSLSELTVGIKSIALMTTI